MWWEQGPGRADGEVGEGRTILWVSFKEKNLGEIFLYATYAKSTSIFNVIWLELYIQHTLKSKSGHYLLLDMIIILLLKLLRSFEPIDFHNT